MREATMQDRDEETAARIDALVAMWPLVGRDALLERVLAAVDADAHGVVLTGPPGVGKSRLARTILAQAARRGAPTEWVQATDATGDLPLGAFGHLLPHGADASTPLDLLRRTAALLQARSRKRRLVLAIDDAHLLDPASATLVHQLASAGNVFVLATIRTGEKPRDAIVSLWKDGLAERIDVDELDEEQVAAALRAALNGDVELASIRRLWAATRGNALFLHELTLAGVASGALARRGETWSWRGPISGEGRLRDVVDARLTPLDERARSALDLLAVGEPLGIDVFERLVGIDVVDALERRELVVVRRDERREEASLTHPVYRDVLLGAMGSEAVAAAQEQLAQAVERAGGRRRGDLLRVAMWRLQGPAMAQPDLLTAAAAEAEARFDPELAERLARAAVTRGGGTSAWHAVASALRAQGRVEEADEAWRTALAAETDPTQRVALAQARSANLFFSLGAGERALKALEDVYGDATTQALRDTIGSLVGMFDLYRGRIDTALAAALPILERGGVKADSRIDAALTASVAYALRGRPSDAIAVVDGNIAVALQDPDVGSIAAGALMAARLLAIALDGRLDEAMDSARVVYELAVDMGAHDGIAGLSFAIGHIYSARGDVESARRHLAEGVALLREHDRNGYLPWCLGELAYVELLAGRLDDARAAAAEMYRVDRPELRLFRPRMETARILLGAIDDPDSAVAALLTYGEQAEAEGHLVLAAMAVHECLRFGGAEPAAAALGRLSVATDSGLVRAFAAHAQAARDGDGEGLDRVATRFEQLGALLHAAEASTAAACAHEASGQNAARAGAAHRAAALMERCPGAAPPWHSVPAAPEALSGRQAEVARLAAQGLSSREIADRLYVSVRTVDNHLYRIYGKLGVDSREELAVVMRLAGGGGESE